MKKMIYQVYTGKSSRLYDWCTDSVEAYAKRIGADYIQLNVPVLKIKPDPFVTNKWTSCPSLAYSLANI